jgi:hypothetical protein
MTVVATIITKQWTAHSSDSFVTVSEKNGNLTVIEAKRTKLVRVEAFSGAISYWGLSRHPASTKTESTWDTLEWLRTEARKAKSYGSPSVFAQHLADSLTTLLKKRRFPVELQKGIGLHFTAFESVSGYHVPELFQIRNWADESYARLRPDGFEVRRETYGAAMNTAERSPEHSSDNHRMYVHKRLQEGTLLYYANGDPTLFMSVAPAIFEGFKRLRERGLLDHPNSAKAHLAMVRSPVKTVADLLRAFSPRHKRAIGGVLHDLAVRPGQIYKTTTGRVIILGQSRNPCRRRRSSACLAEAGNEMHRWEGIYGYHNRRVR